MSGYGFLNIYFRSKIINLQTPLFMEVQKGICKKIYFNGFPFLRIYTHLRKNINIY